MRSRRSAPSAYCAAPCSPRGACCAATPSATGATTPSRPRPCSAAHRGLTPLRHTPEAVSPYASNPLQPLIDFFEAILKFFHDTVGFGWGLSIIVMTLVV